MEGFCRRPTSSQSSSPISLEEDVGEGSDELGAVVEVEAGATRITWAHSSVDPRAGSRGILRHLADGHAAYG